jgi:flagellar biosynthesis protein FlhG
VKLEFLGEVATDKTVREAVTRRQLLLEAFPGCSAAQGVVAAATRLMA